jgi:hypothetical protein
VLPSLQEQVIKKRINSLTGDLKGKNAKDLCKTIRLSFHSSREVSVNTSGKCSGGTRKTFAVEEEMRLENAVNVAEISCPLRKDRLPLDRDLMSSVPVMKYRYSFLSRDLGEAARGSQESDDWSHSTLRTAFREISMSVFTKSLCLFERSIVLLKKISRHRRPPEPRAGSASRNVRALSTNHQPFPNAHSVEPETLMIRDCAFNAHCRRDTPTLESSSIRGTADSIFAIRSECKYCGTQLRDLNHAIE